MISIEDLKRFKESENNVEFKSATGGNFSFNGGGNNDIKKRRRCILGYVTAIANEGGGYLVFGMTDNFPHEVVGTNQSKDNVGRLEADIYNNCGIRIVSHELYENNKRVLVIEIPKRPIGKVYRFEDVPLMRVGEELRVMSDEKYLSIIQEQESDYTAETIDSFSLADIDDLAFDNMRRAYAKKQNNDRFLTLSKTQTLLDLGLMKNHKFTYAALILIGQQQAIKRLLPQSTIVFEFRPAESSINFEQRIEYMSPYFSMIDEIWKQINQRNGRLSVQEGPYIFDLPFFNEEIIREALNNAIAHRDYRKPSEIFVRQQPHSLEICSPGGLPQGVTLSNLLTVNSTPRNRLLAEILQKTGAVERSGQGIDKIYYQSISESKGEPDYSETDDFQVSLKLSAVVQDKAFALFIRNIQNDRNSDDRLSVKDIITLNKVRLKVAKEDLDKSVLAKLEQHNLIERVGKTRSQYYILSKDYYAFTDQRGAYTNEKPIEEIQVLTTVIQHFSVYETAKMADFEKLFFNKLNRHQVRYAIDKFVKNGALTVSGTKKGATYKVSDKMKKSQKLVSRAIELGFEQMKKLGEMD